MPKFPGAVQHNNPVEAILSLPENQVKGLGVFADVAARNALNANMRSEGFIAVVTGLDKVYIYTVASILNADWQNAANWTEIGSGSGSYTLPIATASVLGGIRVGTNLSIDAGTGILSATDTNTTYTAGNGLTLSNTEFNVGGTTNRITVTADTVDIASAYVGQTSITTLGTITTGTWNATSISNDYITSVAGTKVTGNITGNAANVTGTVAIGNGGTGATTAPSARTNLGATTVGSNLFTLTNPSAITFPRINADNTVSALSAADFRTAISAGTGNGTVTSVGISVPTGLSVSNTPVIGSGTIAIALTAGYSIPTTASQNNWDTAFTDRLKWDGGSVGLNTATARTSLGLVINTDVQAYDADLAAIAALTGTTGLLRKTASDTWSLDTTAYLSGTVPISSGGTGATTVGNARINLLPTYSGNNNKALRVNSAGSDVEWSCISKDMFCVPGTLPSTTSHIVTSVYRDGQWRDIEVNGLYSPSGTITVANDSVVVKSINSITPTAGAVTIYGSSIQRTSTNSQTISSGITSLEGSVSAVQFDITNIYEAISPITKVVNKTRFGFSGTSAALETTETSGSFFRGSTGYFFTQASPGVTEIKVLDDSATPVQRTILYGIGRVNGAQVGIHNTSPAYPFDITGNTRVTGNIIVTGTVDGVDISELKNTVDNITVGGTEEIELFSYFIS
jgi:hypothetical protein